ncbi:MAG: hypothetical protein COT88_02365 [Candidatus Colwellbacteria bacterium CG10_big_fil_rev_8_21_14_0_10_41_28]|uniref:Nucleotidyltransferase family protein n=1 Tax=Candidatus Colwellbacteria bacterium CG10_big_fil_rev_8_21_14_0_10_41_28 TaxID=1974539 RepID=A0A2H0VGU2_9BACT|nr:MAG: hypothetical protein COT88_02365 [Candidatus Colwellbacteria bacterium CG10_big_fil_rev_8_21_14_0_10_41_28]
MELKTREDIVEFIKADDWMMDVLQLVSELNLPDWWIAAGFIRNRVWDVLHGYKEKTPLADVDVVYYDKHNLSKKKEREIEEKLKRQRPDVFWEVINQARMHKMHGVSQYQSSEDAISRWVETPTCIGASIDHSGNVKITGSNETISDLVNLIVRKTPKSDYIPKETYIKRVKSKKWEEKWPKLQIIWD